ncbi:MAG TPA: cupin domain-containing protein [Phototrophicaceae bacterium]|nr:cupin domain-containing protein [Phototrophicaceae bacterium]
MASDFVIIHFNETMNKSDHGLIREFGVSASTTGSQSLSMAFGKVPAGSKSKRHYHPFETAVYVISGKARSFFGPNDEHWEDVSAGDFVYIPAGMIHSTEALGDEPVEYILARAAPEDIAISAD